jgi:hypothetical protein
VEILIFTTNIEKPEQVSMVKPLLIKNKAIHDWSFDLEDCDNILRIVAQDISPRYIETLVRAAGFYCQELD